MIRDTKIRFQDVYNEEIIAGGVYNYSEITRLLLSLDKGYDVGTHNFVKSLLDVNGRGLDAGLGANDIVLCNIGPFAYFYHYWRELSGKRYRIVRDVRTAFMMGYFLQETLCAPLTRPEDTVIFPSQYCRELYIKLFPDALTSENTRVCYPLTHFFPPVVKDRPRGNGKEIIIGYSGSCTGHKSIFQVFDIFFELKKRDPQNKYKLHVCGAMDRIADNSAMSLKWIKNAFQQHDVPMDLFKYHGKLPYGEIWKFYRGIDVLLFPGLSNTETFGRVILEASHAESPVITAHYAAASELVPPSNIVTTRFAENSWFSMNDYFSFGQIDVVEAAEKILEIEKLGTVAVARFNQYKREHFLDCLQGGGGDTSIHCSPLTRNFIDSITVRNGARPWRKEALEMIRELASFVSTFEKKSVINKIFLLLNVLPKSSNRARTLNAFLYNLAKGHGIVNRPYMAREFSNFLRFRPEVMLKNNTDPRIA